MPDERAWTRREILQTTAAGTLASSLCGQPGVAQDKTAADPDRIRRENAMPGTREWLATKVLVQPKTKYRCPWVEGYASEDQRQARGNDHAPRQHEPADDGHDRYLSAGLLPGPRRAPRDEAGTDRGVDSGKTTSPQAIDPWRFLRFPQSSGQHGDCPA